MANVNVPPFTEAPDTVVGATPQSVFPFEFPFWKSADILVYVDGVQLAAADYSVEGFYLQGTPAAAVEGGYGSGEVTLDTAVSSCTVTIDRMVVGDRETQFSKTSPLGMPALNGDLNRVTARQQDLKRLVDTNRAYLDDAIEEAGDSLAMIGKADVDGNNLTRTLTDGVARAFGSKDVLSPLDYAAIVTAAAIQLALTKGAALGLPVTIPPGSYALGTSTLSVPAGSVVLADGVTLTTTSTATKFVTLAGDNITIRGLKLEGPGSTFNAGSYGFFATGTVNGAAAAPTYRANINLIDCEATGFGRDGIGLDYVDGAKIVRPRLTNLGYCGVEAIGCKNVVVIEPYIDTLSGETDSGTLNAYGVTFTRNTSSSDLVRYPPSEDCSVVGGIVKNIPTWHGLDTHGGQRCTFRDVTVRECRRAVVLTHATHISPVDCLVQGVRAFNTAAVDAVNSNATEKRAEAFWDIGVSSAIPAKRNRLINNYSFGYGPATQNYGAFYFQNASGGEYLNNTDENSYSVGLRINEDVTDFRLRGHVTRNSRAPASGGYSTVPLGFFITGNNQSGIIENCRTVRDDASVDAYVLDGACYIGTGTGRAIKLRNNDFDGLTTGITFQTADAGITGDVTRDHALTIVGYSDNESVTISATRNGPNVTLLFPLVAGTSDDTAFTMSGLPAEIRPSANRHFPVKVSDNGTVAFGLLIVSTDGSFTVGKTANESDAWTASGTKRLYPIAITYSVGLPE